MDPIRNYRYLFTIADLALLAAAGFCGLEDHPGHPCSSGRAAAFHARRSE